MNSTDKTTEKLSNELAMVKIGVEPIPVETITISKKRLEELEDLERNLEKKIQEAILNNKKESLKRLHEKDKINPNAVKLRIKRYNEKNKDKINERRREKRWAAKALADTEQPVNPPPVVSATQNTVEKVGNSPKAKGVSPRPKKDMTVRFDEWNTS